MYELVRAAQAGKSYPSEVPMELLNSLTTAGIAVMVLGVLYRVLLIAGFGATLGKMVMRISVKNEQVSPIWQERTFPYGMVGPYCLWVAVLTEKMAGQEKLAALAQSCVMRRLQ